MYIFFSWAHLMVAFPRSYQWLSLSLAISSVCKISVPASVDVDLANQTFYMVNATQTLTCSVAGYPSPGVYWEWQPCSTRTSCTTARRVPWTSVSESKNIVQVRRSQCISVASSHEQLCLPYSLYRYVCKNN